MKKSKFTEEQILFALKQGDAGQPVANVAGRWMTRTRISRTGRTVPPPVGGEFVVQGNPHVAAVMARFARCPPRHHRPAVGSASASGCAPDRCWVVRITNI